MANALFLPFDSLDVRFDELKAEHVHKFAADFLPFEMFRLVTALTWQLWSSTFWSLVWSRASEPNWCQPKIERQTLRCNSAIFRWAF